MNKKPDYDKRALQRAAYVLLFYIAILLILSFLPSCTTTKYVPVETIRTETIVKTDSTEINRLLKELAEVKQSSSSATVEKIEQTTTHVVNANGDTIATNTDRSREVIINNTNTVETNRTVSNKETKDVNSNYLKEKTDTVTNIIEVEKELTAWQKFKINFSEIVIGIAVLAISALIIMIVIFRRSKR